MNPPNPSQKPNAPKPEAKKSPKASKEIPLVSVPNDEHLFAEEMEEIFDEDKVTHQHGSSEPEAD